MKAALERRMKGHKLWYLIWITNKTSSLRLCCYSSLFTDHFVCTANGEWQFFSQGKKKVHPVRWEKTSIKSLFLRHFIFPTACDAVVKFMVFFFSSSLSRLLLLKRNLFNDAKGKKTFQGPPIFNVSVLDTSIHAAYTQPNCRIIKRHFFPFKIKLWK